MTNLPMIIAPTISGQSPITSSEPCKEEWVLLLICNSTAMVIIEIENRIEKEEMIFESIIKKIVFTIFTEQ